MMNKLKTAQNQYSYYQYMDILITKARAKLKPKLTMVHCKKIPSILR